MRYALNLSADWRILSATFERYAPADAVLVDELPDGDVSDYLHLDGAYVYDPLPDPELPDTQTGNNFVTWDEMDKAYQEGVDSV